MKYYLKLYTSAGIIYGNIMVDKNIENVEGYLAKTILSNYEHSSHIILQSDNGKPLLINPNYVVAFEINTHSFPMARA